MQISVIIPTYKPQDYLWQCLDSLNAQTLDKKQWEVIVVLNGCAEPWLGELHAYQQSHPDLPMQIIHTEQAGVSNARNIGIERAKGEYIGFIDDDDYVSDTYLEQLLQIAKKDTIALSYTQAFSDTESYIPYYIEQEYQHKAQYGKQAFYKAKKYFGGPCMKLIHRDIIGDTRFDTRFRNGEDSVFMFEVSKRITYVQFTDTHAVYYRRIRTGSASMEQQFMYSMQNKWNMIKAYHAVYWKEPGSYNLWFYWTRILACFHALLKGK